MHSFHEIQRTDEERLIYLNSLMLCFVWGLNDQLLSWEAAGEDLKSDPAETIVFIDEELHKPAITYCKFLTE